MILFRSFAIKAVKMCMNMDLQIGSTAISGT